LLSETLKQEANISNTALIPVELQDVWSKQLPDSFVRDTIAAALIGTSPGTMRRWRLEGRDPRYIRLGANNIKYKISWLNEFVSQRVVETTDTASRRIA
jgi:hypothetical protein